MQRGLFFIPIIILAILGGLFFMGLRQNTGSEIPSTLIGQQMPELPAELLEGFDAQEFDMLASKSNIILVNYWASWCGPCRAEHPNLLELKELGLPIISINYKDDTQKAAKFLQELGNPFSSVHVDNTGHTAIDWGVSGVPETFFVNSKGIVLKRFFGPITQDALKTDILPFIAENS